LWLTSHPEKWTEVGWLMLAGYSRQLSSTAARFVKTHLEFANHEVKHSDFPVLEA